MGAEHGQFVDARLGREPGGRYVLCGRAARGVRGAGRARYPSGFGAPIAIWMRRHNKMCMAFETFDPGYTGRDTSSYIDRIQPR